MSVRFLPLALMLPLPRVASRVQSQSVPGLMTSHFADASGVAPSRGPQMTQRRDRIASYFTERILTIEPKKLKKKTL
uniref:Putative secreted protein n=1 Tax=Anopheles triannulatus TaxID=58253 RepID=A0A2M4B7X4_9DIPT